MKFIGRVSTVNLADIARRNKEWFSYRRLWHSAVSVGSLKGSFLVSVTPFSRLFTLAASFPHLFISLFVSALASPRLFSLFLRRSVGRTTSKKRAGNCSDGKRSATTGAVGKGREVGLVTVQGRRWKKTLGEKK